MKKPYKGVIRDCVRKGVSPEAANAYGPNLGYSYYGTCIGHPNFGTTKWFHTSLVVAERQKKKYIEVETLNSIYHMEV